MCRLVLTPWHDSKHGVPRWATARPERPEATCRPFARAMASYSVEAPLSTSSSRKERRARRDRARQAARLWHLGRCPAHDLAVGRGPVRRQAQYAPGFRSRGAARQWIGGLLRSVEYSGDVLGQWRIWGVFGQPSHLGRSGHPIFHHSCRSGNLSNTLEPA